MILSIKGATNITGSIPEICADASTILSALREILTDKYGKEVAEDVISKVVKQSSMTDEELDAEMQGAKEKLGKIKEDVDVILSELMKKIMKGMGE